MTKRSEEQSSLGSQAKKRPSSRRPLGELEQVLLMALLQLDDRAYGVSVREFVAQRTERQLSPGAVYTAMARLESRGLVKSRLGEPTAVRGGKRKRLYSITSRGSSAVTESYRNLRAVARGLEPLLESS